MEDDTKKTLFVVASSDKGLCGGIHSGLTKATRRLLEKKPNADIVVIGEKCKAQLSRSSGKKIALSFAGIGKDVPTFADAQAIADQISLLPEQYGDIQILYNKFINAQSYEPTPIEAFSEEAIAQSRKQIRRCRRQSVPLIKKQLTLPPLRLMTTYWPTYANTLLPIPYIGHLLRVMRANNPPEEMPWM